jgi:hypothetical protein
MSMWLRQSTASQEILLGRFVSSTDGNTEATTLTILNSDIKLWAEGGTTLASKNSGGATHIAGGLYYAVLDATDTATAGKLEVNVHVAGALAVRREFLVLPQKVYDSLMLGSDNLEVDLVQVLGSGALGVGGTVDSNVVQVAGSTAAATNLAAQMLAQFLGIVSAEASATTTSFTANTTTSPGLSAVANHYRNGAIGFYGGAEAPLARKVTAYSYSAGVGTFTISPALDLAPATDGTAKFLILGYLP